jgi:hypothetical protein
MSSQPVTQPVSQSASQSISPKLMSFQFPQKFSVPYSRFFHRLVATSFSSLLLLSAAGSVPQPTLATALSLNAPQLSPTAELQPHSTVRLSSVQLLPRRIGNRVRRHHARRLNLPMRLVQLQTYSRETWSDSCLGLGKPEEICAQATVAGWRVGVVSGDKTWFYRTDDRANIIRPEEDTQETAIAQILAQAGRSLGYPQPLQLLEQRPASFSGCMGIYEPNQACTAIAISGLRLIASGELEGETQYYVIHASQDGSIVAINQTASGSLSPIVPSFTPFDQVSPESVRLAQDVVFRSISAGRISPRITDTSLMTDGRVIQNDRVIRRISKQQVAAFQQLLETERLPNFYDIGYLQQNVADVPMVHFYGMGIQTGYTATDWDKLPRSLRNIVDAWAKIIETPTLAN